MQRKLKHTFGFISFIALQVPARCNTEDKEVLFFKVDYTLHQRRFRDAFIVFGASVVLLAVLELATGYVVVPMALVQGTQTSLNFSSSVRSRSSGFWYYRLERRRWT